MLKITKNTRKHSLLLLAGFILLAALLGITAKVSYYLGERHISELVLHSDVPDGNYVPAPPVNYVEVIDNLRSERDRLSNDYDSACYNYQTLYDAYDELYAKSGADPREQIVRPDSARGNAVSCYR
jgi:hypothetical protein